jgi:hypothetical protein
MSINADSNGYGSGGVQSSEWGTEKDRNYTRIDDEVNNDLFNVLRQCFFSLLVTRHRIRPATKVLTRPSNRHRTGI